MPFFSQQKLVDGFQKSVGSLQKSVDTYKKSIEGYKKSPGSFQKLKWESANQFTIAHNLFPPA